MLNLDLESRIYRALYSEFELSTDYRRGGPNIELYIGMLNSAECRPGEPNIELYIRMLNIVQNIDLDNRI